MSTRKDADVKVTAQYGHVLDGAGGSSSPTDHGLAQHAERTLSRISTQDPPVFKVYKRRFFGLAQLVLLNIIISWDWITFAPVSRTSAQFFHNKESDINWMSTAFLFCFCAATPFTYWTLRNYGSKFSIIIAAALILVGNWVRYGGTRATNFGVAMLGQLLLGFSQPFVLSAPAHYSNEWFTDKGRIASTAVASLANAFGAALGELIDPFWAPNPSDTPNMVLWISIMSTVASLPSFFIPAHPPTPPSAGSSSIQSAHTEVPILTTFRTLTFSVEFWLLSIPFGVYVGLFNSFSSLINQILEPYGFSEDQAGIAAALLIFVGLVSAAVSSPLTDRYKFYLPLIRIAVVLISLCYLVFIWAPQSKNIVYPYVVCAVMGASSFVLLPVVLEFMVEIHHPLGPELTSSVCWCLGQIFGAIFIIIQDALKDSGPHAHPQGNMKRALIFQAVMAMLAMPLPICLGLFGRGKHVRRKRLEEDRSRAAAAEIATDQGAHTVTATDEDDPERSDSQARLRFNAQ